MRIVLIAACFAYVATACNNQSNTTAAPKEKMATEAVAVDSALAKLSFASKKDPSCGMPLKAGLKDTTTYNGKLYGFCSEECKRDFLTDPAGHLAVLKE